METPNLFKRTKVDPSTGCWLYLGTPRSKYGLSWHQGKNIHAHRLAYMLTKGEPGNLFVCHTCDNPRCINPDHLFLGTPKDNMQDKLRKGRHRSGSKRWSVCKWGHPLSEDNVYVNSKTGHRRCRICRNATTLAHYHKTKQLKCTSTPNKR